MDLLIKRKFRYLGLLSRYQIFVNGNRVGDLGFRGRLVIKNLPDNVEVFAKVGWCKSKILSLTQGSSRGEVVLLVYNRFYFTGLFFICSVLCLFIKNNYLCSADFLAELAYGLFLFSVLLSTVSVTVFKNNYLKIVREKTRE